MAPLVRNAVYALLQMPNSGLSDLDTLLDPTNPTFRRKLRASGHVDANTRKFWERYDQSSYYHKSYEPVMNRFTMLLRPPLSVTLSTPSLSFPDLLNHDRHIIFLNLSRLRGSQQETVGQLLLAQIQQSLFSRDTIPEHTRIPYSLYIDEFQLYAAHSEQSLTNLFNGARKYKLGVTIAHQTTASIPSKLLDTIIGNVGTVIAMQLAANDAPYFARELQLHKHDRDGYHPEALQNLSIGECYVRTHGTKTGTRGRVPRSPIAPIPDPALTCDELITASKHRYGLMPEREPEPDEIPEPNEPRITRSAPLPEPEAPESEPLPPAPRPARKPVVPRPQARKRKSILPDESEQIDVQ
jgi:hypothetical protein